MCVFFYFFIVIVVVVLVAAANCVQLPRMPLTATDS